MNYCGGSIVSSASIDLWNKSFSVDRKAVKESARINNLSVSNVAPEVLLEVKESVNENNLKSSCNATPANLSAKSNKNGLNNCFGGFVISSYLETPYKFNENEKTVAPSSCFQIDWHENSPDLEQMVQKKNPKNKKHTNSAPLTDKEKASQKRRQKKLRLFNTEERFEDKMPYICFECKKMFGFYSSLDEHGNSHSLNKLVDFEDGCDNMNAYLENRTVKLESGNWCLP